jgi:hypothetical protein
MSESSNQAEILSFLQQVIPMIGSFDGNETGTKDWIG